ncbi:MAG: acyl-CoA dehydrogenase family protein [Polyangiaceae bacterium]|nr:acyl-CoA dehydrogenase family protein [Myxococcales bacterium]MCB9585010.1 acyl-CoA dehydrogenase family protein [Polyangiaceae bacterium]
MIEGSFSKALFFGVIAEDLIFPYPLLADPERERVQTLVHVISRLADSEIDSERIDRDAQLSPELLVSLKELGLFGTGLPVSHGGMGLTCMGYTRVLEELGAADPSVALSVFASESLAARTIQQFGSPELKQRYLPKLASGERLGAFALAEEGSGSDASAMRTLLSAKGDGYSLSGEKRWVTGGNLADIFVVFARTSAPHTGNKPNMTAVVVERGPGVATGDDHDKLGLRGAGMCDLRLADVALDQGAILGEPGKGHAIAMEVLSAARVPLSGVFLGMCRKVVGESVRWVQERYSFGRSIGEFSIIKDKIARMLSDTFAIESMVHLTAGLVDQHIEDYSLESSMCRVAGSEALWRVVGDAVSLAGGSAYVRPHAFERYLRDARGSFVIDGTNEILRCFIALSGMHGPGKKRSEVVGAMREPVKGFGLLRDFAVRKVKETFRRERLSRAHPLLGREAVAFEEATDAFQQAVDRALTEHGTEIAEMQYVQLRIANAAIDLYALAACIARTSRAIQQRGEEGARRELDMTSMFSRAAILRIRGNLNKLDNNDDELRKLIASRAYEDNGYPFDVL